MFSKIGKLSLKIITTLKKIIYINIRYSFKKGLIKKQKLASVHLVGHHKKNKKVVVEENFIMQSDALKNTGLSCQKLLRNII